MKVSSVRASLGFVAALVLLILPSFASAAWTGRLALSGPNADEPDVAVDADGNAVAAWERTVDELTRIEARSRSAAGGLGPVQLLSPPGQDASEADVAVDPAGNAIVAWEGSDGANQRVLARTISEAGALGPVMTLSRAGQNSSRARAEMDATGDALVVWQRDDGMVQARSISSGGVPGDIETLSSAVMFGFSPDLAVAPDGEALFAWTSFLPSPPFTQRIEIRRRLANGTLEARQAISPVAGPAGRPHVSVDPDGDAVVVWEHTAGSELFVEARGVSGTGTLAPIQKLSLAGQSAAAPEVGLDAVGNASFAWEGSDGPDRRVFGRSRSAGGVLSPVRRLSGDGQGDEDVELAVDAGGGGVVIWERFDVADRIVQARTFSTTGVLGPVDDVSRAGVDASEPRVDVDPDGDAVAVWVDAALDRIVSAAGP